MTLQFLDAARAGGRSPEVAQAMSEAFEDIERRGLVPGLRLGDIAPDFDLPDQNGNSVSLSTRLADGPVVLTFYRGAWCPYCNLELRAYEQARGIFAEMGAHIIAVSPQLPDATAETVQKNDLRFDVLSDVWQTTLADYGLRFEVPEPVRSLLFPAVTAALAEQGSWTLPAPATFVIDQQRVIRARHVSMNFSSRMEPTEALQVVTRLRS
ncbi:AhpC/TSA family protein [Pseudonocardiaceae bacterium YIM PH 21723]|nr:AhpC/TSA family protein [Pseudonocardiaceae bacterium YIM PH 21723]